MHSHLGSRCGSIPREPEWMLQWRLKAYRHWLTLEEPRWWPNVTFPPVDYQDMIYYAAPKPKKIA